MAAAGGSAPVALAAALAQLGRAREAAEEKEQLVGTLRSTLEDMMTDSDVTRALQAGQAMPLVQKMRDLR
jgi:hypothetical protein